MIKDNKYGLVSVVIPVYNAENYISNCIASVLSQTYPNIEILIIDDGSTDSSIDIVESYQDSRISIYNLVNGGASSARNYGNKKSKGEWLAFIDADDIWRPEKIHTQLEQSEGYLWSYTNCEYIADSNLNGKTQSDFINAFSGDIFDKLVISNFICTSSVMLNSEIYRKYSFDESLKLLEDWDLWIRISKKYPGKFIEKAITIYREHQNSSTTSSVPKNLQAHLNLVKINSERYFDNHTDKEKYFDTSSKKAYIINSYIAEHTYQYLLAFKYLFYSFRYGVPNFRGLLRAVKLLLLHIFNIK